MNRDTWISLYQWAAGLCDTCTGILLVTAPAFTFHLMRLSVLPHPVSFARFVGIFVLGVGLSYLWPAFAWPRPEWRAQWWTTALIRSGVAILLTWQVAAGSMERGWLAVILTDALLASIQWMGLSRGWLNIAG